MTKSELTCPCSSRTRAATRSRLWFTLSNHFFPALHNQPDIKQLSEKLGAAFEEMSGRDIKMVLNLARRYHKKTDKSTPWDVKDFERLVKFRTNPNNSNIKRTPEIVEN